jgi:hypothetical protein
MANDIVKKLRFNREDEMEDWWLYGDLFFEAADEIERLQEVVKELRKELKREKRQYGDHIANLGRKNSELRAEIERIQEAHKKLSSFLHPIGLIIYEEKETNCG